MRMQQIFSESGQITVNRDHGNCRIDLQDADTADVAESSGGDDGVQEFEIFMCEREVGRSGNRATKSHNAKKSKNQSARAETTLRR